MVSSPSELVALLRSPTGQTMLRYSATSLICVVISTVILSFLIGILQWDAFAASLTACAISTVPSYELNRRWAWGKSGKSHMMKEVLPFWIMAFIGLAFSTWTSVQAQNYARHHHLSRLWHTVVVDGAFIGAFGVLWIAKFLIINRFLFTHSADDGQLVDQSTAVAG